MAIIKKIKYFFRTLVNKLIIKQLDKDKLNLYWSNPDIDKSSKKSNDPERFADKKLHPRSELIVNTIKQHVNKDCRIIELGCSIGRNLNLLMDEGFSDLYGIELNPKAIPLMETNYPNLNQIIKNIEIGTIQDKINKYPEEYFDIVFSMATLQHIHKDEENKVFKGIKRICKKYLIVIEDEMTFSNRHFPRNYNKIFSKLDFKQIYCSSDKEIEKAYLPFTYSNRVFKKIINY